MVGIFKGLLLANKLAGVDLGYLGPFLLGDLFPYRSRCWYQSSQYHCDFVLYYEGGRILRILLDKLIVNYPYFACHSIYDWGSYAMLTRSNLFKKRLGLILWKVNFSFVCGWEISGRSCSNPR